MTPLGLKMLATTEIKEHRTVYTVLEQGIGDVGHFVPAFSGEYVCFRGEMR